jgi:hypothetical protein
MGQLITTLVSVMILLVVPLGVVQIHTVSQMRSELIDLSLAATKYLSNHGGKGDAEVQNAVQQFVSQELASKVYRIEENELQIQVTRVHAADPTLWSHEDVFKLRLQIPYPGFTTLFSEWEAPIAIERTGTINVMDYDL